MKKTEKPIHRKNVDPHQVLYIPHGFDVFTFSKLQFYIKKIGKKLVFLRFLSDFCPPKREENHDFFERCGNAIRPKKTMLCSTLGLPETVKNDNENQ